MDYNKNKQLTVGDLKKLLEKVPDDINLYTGWGSESKPLRFLDIYRDGIKFHPDIYGESANIFNWLTVSNFIK